MSTQKNTLAKLVAAHDKIFIDTCSLLEENIDSFLEELNFYVEKSPNVVYTYIHQKVRDELHKHEKGQDSNKQARARMALQQIKLYEYNSLLTRIGHVGDKFADNALYVEISKARLECNVLLITEDKKLANDVLGLNNLKSQKGKNVSVYSIREQFNTDGGCKQPKLQDRQAARKLDETLIETSIPSSGDTVYIGNKSYVLGKQIGKTGGEGSCYRVGEKFVCKIYIKEKLTVWRREKLKYMVNHPIENDSICWPKGIVTNKEGEFVGYLMPVATGKSLEYLINDIEDKRKYVKNKLQLINICKNIANAFSVLHKNGVIMGDVSANNILFNKEKVVLIDMDSVQVGGYPCKMFTEGYVAPEHIGADKITVKIPEIRDPQNEVFNVSILLFQLLVGNNPYFCKGDNDESIYANYGEKFPYPLKPNIYGGDYSTVPQGCCQTDWDRLYYKLKTAFRSSFKANGKRNKAGDRFDIGTWSGLLKGYGDFIRTLPENDDGNKVVCETWSTAEYVGAMYSGDEAELQKLKQGVNEQKITHPQTKQTSSVSQLTVNKSNKSQSDHNKVVNPENQSAASGEKKSTEDVDRFREKSVWDMERRVNKLYPKLDILPEGQKTKIYKKLINIIESVKQTKSIEHIQLSLTQFKEQIDNANRKIEDAKKTGATSAKTQTAKTVNKQQKSAVQPNEYSDESYEYSDESYEYSDESYYAPRKKLNPLSWIIPTAVTSVALIVGIIVLSILGNWTAWQYFIGTVVCLILAGAGILTILIGHKIDNDILNYFLPPLIFAIPAIVNFILICIFKAQFTVVFLFVASCTVLGCIATAIMCVIDGGKESYNIISIIGAVLSLLGIVLGAMILFGNWFGWQFVIGILGGAVLFGIGAVIAYVFECGEYIFALFYVAVVAIANAVLFFVFVAAYKVIFICISAYVLLAAAIDAYIAFDDEEGGWGISSIAEAVATAAVLVCGLIFL